MLSYLTEQEKRFKWIDNSTVAFQFWAVKEPNGELDVEYCVALSTNSSGQWYDTEGCNVLSRAFVCKSDRVPIQRTQPQYQNIVTGQFYSDTGIVLNIIPFSSIHVLSQMYTSSKWTLLKACKHLFIRWGLLIQLYCPVRWSHEPEDGTDGTPHQLTNWQRPVYTANY